MNGFADQSLQNIANIITAAKPRWRQGKSEGAQKSKAIMSEQDLEGWT